MVISDGCTYSGPANQFSPPLGVQFVSTQCCDCDHCGGEVGCCISTDDFTDHEIWDNVLEIQANLNEGDLLATEPAEIIASHNGINMVAIRDADCARVAWDSLLAPCRKLVGARPGDHHCTGSIYVDRVYRTIGRPRASGTESELLGVEGP